MGTRVAEVDLVVERAVVAVLSESSTVYYIDTRGEHARVMRCREGGRTGTHPLDDQWLYLKGFTSYPVGMEAGEFGQGPAAGYSHTVLRVGSRHQFFWTLKQPRTPLRVEDFVPRLLDQHYFLQRMCTELRVLDDLPPEGMRTRSAAEVDFDNGPEPGSRL